MGYGQALSIMGWGFTKSKGLGHESYMLVGLHLATEFWSFDGQALLTWRFEEGHDGVDERMLFSCFSFFSKFPMYRRGEVSCCRLGIS